eukprot:TRINITY_DN14143_c0_g1_i3.p1 TRINITY_DN14143_c0_g1~~TRINITY_DN14143_c0_g1_i3.p1  ORF type:complete len:100 (+),score=27.51 TRINITY_DN14143_c0_g1_i3:108-407(+)
MCIRDRFLVVDPDDSTQEMVTAAQLRGGIVLPVSQAGSPSGVIKPVNVSAADWECLHSGDLSLPLLGSVVAGVVQSSLALFRTRSGRQPTTYCALEGGV